MILEQRTPPKGTCPIHGIVYSSVSVTLDHPAKGEYCLTCYAEWLAKNITKLAPPEGRR